MTLVAGCAMGVLKYLIARLEYSNFSSEEAMSHQFTHTNAQRRASVIYGDGKAGLFVPSDFIKSPPIIDDDSSAFPEDDEELPLLLSSSSAGGKRSSIVDREVLASERDLLLANDISVSGDDDNDVRSVFENAVISNKLENPKPLAEFMALFKALVPLVTTFLLENSLSTVSVFSVGHLGATELAAVSMGSMTANITGYATIHGIATALDTMCPQAFGAKKYRLVGVYMQKCIALIAVVMLPVLIAWIFFGYQLITLILPDKETAKLSAAYLRFIAPGIPAYIAFECGKRFLQAQGIYHISTYVLLFSAPLNLVMNIIMVRHFGYLGAPVAVAINYWLMAIGLYVATVFCVKAKDTPSGHHPLVCWGGLDIKRAFSGWGNLARLAIPGFIMLEAEFLAFEILTVLASYLGTIPLAAQSIGSTMATVTYQVPFAIGIAASTRIANYLGAGLARAAKTATIVAICFGLVVSVVNFMVLYTFQVPIAKLFTNDEVVIKMVQTIMWLIALMQVSDAMNANSAGCLRGQGQTKIGGIVNLVSYYMVGIPLSIYLTFYSPWKGSLKGLWIGTTLALTIIGVVQSYFALSADFDKLVIDAATRTSESTNV